jgi:membrane-anchored glycerophosphoryl diester phosphodiesterase (GDPDase)
MIFSHHILFTYLVETVAHFCKHLLFEKLELLQLDKLYVLNRALRWLFHFIINHLGQDWVRRNCTFHLLFD